MNINQSNKLFEDIVDKAYRQLGQELGESCVRTTEKQDAISGRSCIVNFTGGPVSGRVVVCATEEYLDATAPVPGKAQDWLNEMTNHLIGRIDTALQEYGGKLKSTPPMPAASRAVGGDYSASSEALVYKSAHGQSCLWIHVEWREPLEEHTPQPRPVSHPMVPASAHTPSSSRRAILLVDDSKSAREPAKKALTSAGYQVVEAESGNQALRILKRQKDIGLVVSDLHMAGGSGLSLVKAMKVESNLAGLPIVIATAASGNGHEVTAVKELGVSLVLLKPVSSDAFKTVADRLVGPS